MYSSIGSWTTCTCIQGPLRSARWSNIATGSSKAWFALCSLRGQLHFFSLACASVGREFASIWWRVFSTLALYLQCFPAADGRSFCTTVIASEFSQCTERLPTLLTNINFFRASGSWSSWILGVVWVCQKIIFYILCPGASRDIPLPQKWAFNEVPVECAASLSICFLYPGAAFFRTRLVSFGVSNIRVGWHLVGDPFCGTRMSTSASDMSLLFCARWSKRYTYPWFLRFIPWRPATVFNHCYWICWPERDTNRQKWSIKAVTPTITTFSRAAQDGWKILSNVILEFGKYSVRKHVRQKEWSFRHSRRLRGLIQRCQHNPLTRCTRVSSHNTRMFSLAYQLDALGW